MKTTGAVVIAGPVFRVKPAGWNLELRGALSLFHGETSVPDSRFKIHLETEAHSVICVSRMLTQFVQKDFTPFLPCELRPFS